MNINEALERSISALKEIRSNMLQPGGSTHEIELNRRKIIASEALDAIYALRSHQPEQGAEIIQPERIKEVLAEGDGIWRTCSGCFETEDGQNVHGYAHSKVFGCTLGSGCGECGGIGAIWDTTDYDAMADSFARELGTPARDWVLLPKTMTPEMQTAFAVAFNSPAPKGPNPTNSLDRMYLLAQSVYSAVVSAAPTAPVPQEPAQKLNFDQSELSATIHEAHRASIRVVAKLPVSGDADTQVRELRAKLAVAQQLVADLSGHLSDEGDDWSTDGLGLMRRRVATAVPLAILPDWLHEYATLETEGPKL